ncbi:MAG: hypothetical protein RDU13_10245, partial [Elusimicrobiales bacterium]|nr:hypothetical protein [Elusimicrobiales bacterium]
MEPGDCSSSELFHVLERARRRPRAPFSFCAAAFLALAIALASAAAPARARAEGSAPVSAPQLVGSALGVSSIAWTWAAVEGASGYRVYSGDGYSLLYDGPSARYELAGLGINTRNNICASAYNPYGETPPSCEPSVYTLAAVPGAPAFNLISSHSFQLEWSPGPNPYWDTGYQISLSTDGFALDISTPVPVSAGLRDFWYPLDGLAAGTVYSARVQAYNGDGVLTGFSETASAATLAAPPEPPENLAVVFSTAAKSAALTWTAAAAGTPAASFNLYRALGAPEEFGSLITGLTAPSFEEPLFETATYYYRAAGVNADGLEGEPSPHVSLFADPVPPGQVSDLSAGRADPDAGTIVLSWTAPWEDHALGRYLIRDVPNGSWDDGLLLAEVAASTGPGGRETLTLSFPSTDTVRYVALKAVDAFGNESPYISNAVAIDFEPPTLAVSGAPEPETVVNRPFSVHVSAIDNYTMWMDYLLDGAELSSYYFGAGSLETDFLWDIAEFTDGPHVFGVRARDQSGNTALWELPVTVNYAPPAAPAITWPDGGAVALSTPAVDVSGQAEPGVYVSLFVDDAFIASAYSADGYFGFSAVPLPGDGTFLVTAQASDKKGSSPRSAPLAATVDTGPPGAPLNFSAGSAAGGAVTLLWSAPEGEAPVSYDVYRSADAGALAEGAVPPPELLAAAGVAAAEYTDLPPADGVYYYGAVSADAPGNRSALSNISAAVSDRVGPSAAVSLSSAPPLGAGSYAVSAAVSEPLAGAPYLTFTPYGQSPVQVRLSPGSALVWTGTLTVTADMASGEGEFAFGASDLSGNTGGPVTSGRTLTLDTRGPSAVLSLTSDRPALKPGSYAVELALDKPAREAPVLEYSSAGGPARVELSSGTDAALWTGALTVDALTGEGPHDFFYSAYDALGNRGELLAGATFFAVDTVAPDAPLSLNGQAGAGGAVSLGWSWPGGEPPAAYCLYRDGALLNCAITPAPVDLTGSFTDQPPEGPRTYAVSALDAAGNESALSVETVIPSDATPPEPPVITSWSLEAGDVHLSWSPGGAEVPASYRLYRATHAFASAAGLPYRVLVGTSAADTPPSDGYYYYALTALDAPGNESALSAPTGAVPYDGSAPLITITGLADGGHYAGPVRPSVTITDLDLSLETVTLNGAAFASGAAVDAEGAHLLEVYAEDAGGRISQKSAAFTIDRTSPAITVAGVADGGYYEEPVVPVITAADLNLSTFAAALNGEPFASGTAVSAGGAYTLAVTAADKAGNAAELLLAFTVNPPPPAPAGFAVVIEDGKAAALAWDAVPGAALYKVYKDGVYLGPAQAAAPVFRDAAYTASGARVYEVSAIDSKGREGARARAEVPPVTLTLAGYGTWQDGAEALNRGFFDLVRLELSNSGTQAAQAGPAVITLDGLAPAQSPAVEVPAGGAAGTSAAVYVSTSLPSKVSGRATASVAPGVTLAVTFAAAAREPRQPVLEVYPEALVRGAYANVRLKFNNRGSAPLDIITARLADGKAAPSGAGSVKLAAPSGLTLSRAELSQTAGAAITMTGGEQLWFVTVPGGGSFTFDPLRPAVPPDAEEALTVTGELGGLAHGLAAAPVYSAAAFTAAKTALPGDAAPYSVTLAPGAPFYDKGSTVTLSGFYADLWGNPL